MKARFTQMSLKDFKWSVMGWGRVGGQAAPSCRLTSSLQCPWHDTKSAEVHVTETQGVVGDNYCSVALAVNTNFGDYAMSFVYGRKVINSDRGPQITPGRAGPRT